MYWEDDDFYEDNYDLPAFECSEYLPDDVNEVIKKEYIKLKDSEVIVIEVYNIKE